MTAALDRRALGLALTRLANASLAEVLSMAPARTDRDVMARRIGLTGPPGAGKSSLGGRLAVRRAEERSVGYLAIDPTSRRTGGAILGDRIRIDDLAGAGNLYIRSLASRNAIDGLADNLPEMLEAMEAAGFDEIVLETVGVGQAEHAARDQVDTLVLVLHPDSGDMVQAMKAGIMELADLYVIHKADLPGAQRMAGDIQRVLRLATPHIGGWVPPVVLTSASDADSVVALSSHIDRHQVWLNSHADASAMRSRRARYRLRSLLERYVATTIAGLPPEFFEQGFERQYDAVLQRLVESRRVL